MPIRSNLSRIMCEAPSELRCVLCTNRLSPVLPALVNTAGLSLVGLVHPAQTLDSINAIRQHTTANIPLFEYLPEHSHKLADFLHDVNAQLLVVHGFQHIIPQAILEQCPGVNLHPSLLPAYPGLNPWQEQLQANPTTGGYTVHMLSPKADAGTILAQAEFPWPRHSVNLLQIRDDSLRNCGIPLLIKTLLKFTTTK